MTKALIATPDPDEPYDSGLSAWSPDSRAQRRVERGLFRHQLSARARAEIDRMDGEAVADAIRESLDNELDLLEWGIHRADGSAAKTELVARKVSMLSQLNDRRLTRNFKR
jgi:hypothetical protein